MDCACSSPDPGLRGISVCAGPDGVYVVDVSTPTSPTLAHAFPGFTVANHLEVSDGVLYVASESTGSVGIWDLANPALPVSIATRITGPFDEFEIWPLGDRPLP